MLARELLRAALILASLVPASLIIAALFVSRRSPFGAALRVTSLTVKLSIAAVALRGLSAFFSRLGFSANGIRTGSRGVSTLSATFAPSAIASARDIGRAANVGSACRRVCGVRAAQANAKASQP